MNERSVVVIGGGHNGLVAAWRLARAGRHVVVCETRAHFGGLCAGEEFHPGFRSTGLLQETGGFRGSIAREMQLGRFGRTKVEATTTQIRSPIGGATVSSEAGRYRCLLANEVDVAAFDVKMAWVERVAPVLRRLLDEAPPKLGSRAPADLWGLGVKGLALRRLGRKNMTELLRVLPMTAADWLRETLADETLIEGLLIPALLGSWLGPHSAGSSASLLFRLAAQGDETVGGPASLVESLLGACRDEGVELRAESEVEKIDVGSSGVSGVRLTSGELIACSQVLATCEPKRALLGMLDQAVLPLRMAQQLNSWRTRGSVSKCHLALESPLVVDGAPIERLIVGTGTVDGMEQAFDATKYRRCSEVPLLDVQQPTVKSPQLAPAGKHVVSILVGYTPYALEGGWTTDARQALLESVIGRLESTADASLSISGSEFLAPPDIEKRYGVTGGQIHHGEQGLDQLLFVRPHARLAHYETPVTGLFIGGSGSHPGGGVTGVPGWLAAGAMVAD